MIHRMEANNTPYLRITTFNEHTTEAAVRALNDLREAYGGPLPGLIPGCALQPGRVAGAVRNGVRPFPQRW